MAVPGVLVKDVCHLAAKQVPADEAAGWWWQAEGAQAGFQQQASRAASCRPAWGCVHASRLSEASAEQQEEHPTSFCSAGSPPSPSLHPLLHLRVPRTPASQAVPLPVPHPAGRLGRGCRSMDGLTRQTSRGKTQAWGHRAAPLEDLSGWKISLKRLFSASEEYESRTG